MAQNSPDNALGVVDKRMATRAGTNANPLGTPLNYTDINKLRTRLFAISPTAYSQANLDKMTENDMVLALRQADDAAGI